MLKNLFFEYLPTHWLAPVLSEETGFRSKAKMVVLGTVHAPILGIETKHKGQIIPVSLVDCSLYPPSTRTLLTYLQSWIRRSAIPPYDKTNRRGELKYILLTRSEHSGEYMLRLVMRSREAIVQIEKSLPMLLEASPTVKVVSINIQPVHMARLEGEEEIYLTETEYLTEQFNDVPMVIRPKSFFQTNPKMAERLYATARQWVREIQPDKIWDLFCGVGGFALHCAGPNTAVTGIEIEPEAIISAESSAQAMGLTNIDFAALDSATFSATQANAPSFIIVNPPRRGLGAPLVEQLVTLAPRHILYSSCNPDTLLADIQGMPNYQPIKLQWFDMFPHTNHVEVMLLMERTTL